MAIQSLDDGTIKTRDGSMAHHEHTLVITRARPVVLTIA
jgi:methionine aminopeptidase